MGARQIIVTANEAAKVDNLIATLNTMNLNIGADFRAATEMVTADAAHDLAWYKVSRRYAARFAAEATGLA